MSTRAGQSKPLLERLTWVANQLRAGEFVNTSTIANHFEMTTKTAQRDLEFLRDRLGYDIEYDQPSHSYILIKAPAPTL